MLITIYRNTTRRVPYIKVLLYFVLNISLFFFYKDSAAFKVNSDNTARTYFREYYPVLTDTECFLKCRYHNICVSISYDTVVKICKLFTVKDPGVNSGGPVMHMYLDGKFLILVVKMLWLFECTTNYQLVILWNLVSSVYMSSVRCLFMSCLSVTIVWRITNL